MTILQHLIKAVRAAATYNPDVRVAPGCILWPDAEGQWLGAIPLLQAQMPELYALGIYEPQKRQGPAIWLRCVLAGCIDDLPDRCGMPPVFYLPNVSRRDLRAVESCPDAVKPLAWLQYRGVIFSQVNAKDWTIMAMLKSGQGGLGLDVAQDADSKEAMLTALPRLLEEDVASFGSKRLDAAFFNSLMTGDPVREILHWLNDETAFAAARNTDEIQAFNRVCKSKFGFDPHAEGVLSACALLAGRKGPWKNVWIRYAESWRNYPHIFENIKKCAPPKGGLDWLLADAAYVGWPQWNQDQEDTLAAELLKLANLAPEPARTRILELEKRHRPRLSLLWAEMGHARLAQALEHLAILASESQNALAFGEFTNLANAYSQHGWKVDDAAIQALARVETARDRQIVSIILNGIYRPWLEEGSLYLQKLAAISYPDCPAPALAAGECLLFVDGLRFDLAKRLAHLMRDAGLAVDETIAWNALPTVTPTGKPAVSPCRQLISGHEENADFEPSIAATGSPLKGHFEQLLEQCGCQLLTAEDCGDCHGKAWAEIGKIDHMGHDDGVALAAALPGLLGQISGRVNDLLAAGWKRVQIVTDHGWLLLPGGLPKYNLEACLAENKWGRCACIKSGAASTLYQYPWFWNKDRYFALAPGICCFKKGQEYSHGGISLQECLSLRLSVEKTGAAGADLKILAASWRGLRCKITVYGASESMRADIRKKPANAATSLVTLPKAIKPDGSVSLTIENEDLEGDKAWLVILDQNNALLAQAETVIGGN